MAVNVELPLVGVLNVPVPPLTIDHAPDPIPGVFPPNALLTKVPQRFWIDPTVAVVGVA